MRIESHELFLHTLTAWRSARVLGYIDPGTGSYGYQLLIAGLTGVLFFFSSIKRKLLSLFTKNEPAPGLDDAPPSKDALARESKDQSAVQRN
jgi:hypothetical protein